MIERASRKKSPWWSVVVGAVAACAVGLAAAPARAQYRPDAVMLRNPDVSKDSIVFRFAGDLWLVDKRGGVARPLSSPAGSEAMPKFSPDGRQVAFMAGYDGGSDLYVLAIDGGVPFRVTHHPDREMLCDWDPSGRELIFFASSLSGQQRAPKLFRVRAANGQPVALPVPYGAWGAVDETDTWLAYCPQTYALTATWKRYQGGLAEDVWLFNLKTRESRRVTDFPGLDALPMWHGRTLYFLSDRETLHRNLWSFDVQSGDTKQVTDFDSDVRFPSVGPDDIVFENGGRLWRYEFATSKSVAVEVQIPTDRPNLRARAVDCSTLAGPLAPGPNGKRAVVSARGELFTLPAKDGAAQNLTRSDGVAERFPSWSPDGKWIAYFTDRSGENELAVRSGDGRPFRWQSQAEASDEKSLTQLGPGYRFRPVWSPDSRALCFPSHDGALHCVTIDDGAHSVVDTDPDGRPGGAAWSPDSRWIAYTRRGTQSRLSTIWLYDTATRQNHEVTSGQFSDAEPVFEQGGDWLFFTRQATFDAIYSDYDETWIYANSRNLIAVPLRADVKNPWAPKSDDEAAPAGDAAKGGEKKDDAKAEEAKDETKKDDAKKDEPKKEEPVKPVEILFDGFEARALVVDVPAGRITDLQGAKGKVLYRRLPRSGASGESANPDDDAPRDAGALCRFDLESKKEEKILEGVSGYEACAKANKVLVRVGPAWGFVELAKEQKLEDKIALTNLVADVDPMKEWDEIVTDCGRVMRDYFYTADMHRVDWNAVVARYRAALSDCTAREDVDFLIREMIAELNVGHAYDRPPADMDDGRPARPVGLLGCDWALERGAYKVARLVGGGAYDADARSPLALPGVDVKAGEFVLAVNEAPIDAGRDVYAAFEGTAGKPTWITVNGEPNQDGKERRVLVQPIASEAELRYRDWVAANRELVRKLSDGRIGYVHVPDTGLHGQNELVRQFMGAFDKDALLIDERWNSGGQIPTRFIELLDRPVTNYWAVRHGEDWAWPPVGHRGPKCMLINGSAGSGGDCFPWFFRQAKLGKLIGRRTWGGLVGISGNPGFVDGSAITVPTFGFYKKDGTWAVEGHGVDPDLEVMDDPAKMVNGDDPQLLAGVQWLQKQLETWKFDRPKRPAPPDRSKAGIPQADR